jgi:nucleoside-diphosphate-sugar epimerase
MIARLVPPDITYDALIDFCAHKPGDIRPVIDALGGRIKQYIFFSTAGVYAPGTASPSETSPVINTSEDSRNPPEFGSPRAKLLLERELIESCEKADIKYTILRPAFIYGPFNYAPRESFYIQMIARKNVVPVPTDATARFNFVYVLDVADALMACIGNPRAYNEIFNLAGVEDLTYQQLIADFERYNSGPFETREFTTQEAAEKQIPFPFPLTEDAVYNGRKITQTLNFKYTPFSEGMEKTFKIFYSLYTT